MVKIVSSGDKHAPICQNRTIWQRIRRINDHAWVTNTSLYGLSTRRCIWCGLEQYKHRNIKRWVTVK